MAVKQGFIQRDQVPKVIAIDKGAVEGIVDYLVEHNDVMVK